MEPEPVIACTHCKGSTYDPDGNPGQESVVANCPKCQGTGDNNYDPMAWADGPGY